VNEFWITCPAAGTKVSTGVKATPELLAEPLGTAASLMICPACGKEHIWTPRGAVVLEEQTTAEAPQSDPPSRQRKKKRKPEKPIEIIE
jgi:hypothetical protein